MLKLYGARAVELTGFFGGLVNSTVTVTAARLPVVRETHDLADAAYSRRPAFNGGQRPSATRRCWPFPPRLPCPWRAPRWS